MKFNDFCYTFCDELYLPNLPENSQSTGYHQLKKMVVDNIEPASLDEIKRWETNPTPKEISATPDIKYLRFLHPILRPYIIQNWELIKKLEM